MHYDEAPINQLKEGEIFVVKAKKAGFDYLPVFPARRGDDTLELFDGIMLNCLGLKEIQPGAFMYEMEVITGNKSGDVVWVGHTLVNMLEQVPSKKRMR